MSAKNNGGPAFPCEVEWDQHGMRPVQTGPSRSLEQGLSIRDYFAAKALPAMSNENYSVDDIAAACYQLADAMLKERAK